MNVKKSFFHSWVISSSVLSWPLVSVFLCVSTCHTRPSDSSKKSLNSHFVFCVSVFLSVPADTIRQFPKVTGQPLTPGETQEIDPLPFVNYKYDTVCLGNMIHNTIQSVWEGNSGPNGMKDGVRQGQGHGCKQIIRCVAGREGGVKSRGQLGVMYADCFLCITEERF